MQHISAEATVAENEISVPSSDPMCKRVQQRCEEIASFYHDLYLSADKTEPRSQWDTPVLSQGSMDAIEKRLMDEGLDIMDTYGTYPGYLTTAENFRAFWDAVKRQEAAEQEVISIQDSGTLVYQLFTCQDGAAFVYSMRYPVDGREEPYYEKREVLDWELTDKGNFYYRIYPAGDQHYADYSLIRLASPDLELYDLTMKYIWAGGYIGANLFLTDWTENDWGNLSFNDLWEYLYYDSYGEQFLPDGYPYLREQSCYAIPGAEFEKVVMPYFRIDLDTFRELAQYNAEGGYYPWRQVETRDYVFLSYYTIEPEVTACQVNADGTITLTVQALSTDLKTDCLFAHEVTVRPLENGRFQYVGNKVTYQTEYGLPYSQPRLSWDETN